MKLVLFGEGVPGVVVEETVVDLSEVVGPEIMGLPVRDRMAALIVAYPEIAAELEAAAAAGTGTPLSEVELLAPLPRPGKILCAAGNYAEEVDGPVRPPFMFLKAATTVIGPGGTVNLPPTPASVFQHEAELAVVIGRPASRVDAADALAHVFGYCCFIDVSARGVSQAAAFADKSIDTFGPLGPWIVTADEFGDPGDVAVRLSVNGKPRQDYRTSDMERPVAELIAWASSIATLEPGDLISCGTNHQGLGPVQDGDKVEITIEGIGAMSVGVADGLGRRWTDRVDSEQAAYMRRARTEPGELPPARFRVGAAVGKDPLEAVAE
jgi:2-keto-4-pentenoate hydratase/2-oxohepta-3-ene-1,7-dioic acid hydratase in catechol pathway